MQGSKGTAIDVKGYAVLLNAFCKMSFGSELSVPSLHYYFEIVKDMRQSGHEFSLEVYTILLRQLASLATRLASDSNLPEGISDELVTAIRRAHDHLTVDASITPDTIVWNQLMDTYQRAGCFGEAYRVWEMMYLSGTFDNASVSIILDACGYARAWPIATQICLKLLKNGFSFNRKNWNAWVECLCRLGKLNEALKIVCLEMGKGHDRVAPDEESIRILMKFAIKSNQQSEIQSRIKRYLPDLWQKLPPDLRGSG
jgi:pentatricopeptide repeat protein